MPVYPIASRAPHVSTRPGRMAELFLGSRFKYRARPGPGSASERDDGYSGVVEDSAVTLDAAGYRDLALGDVRVAGAKRQRTHAQAVSACARCHGGEGERPMSCRCCTAGMQTHRPALKAYEELPAGAGIHATLGARLARRRDRRPGLHRTENLRLKMEPCLEKGASSRSKVCQRRVFPSAWRAIAAQVVRHLASLVSMAPDGGLSCASGHVPETASAAMMAPIAQRLSDGANRRPSYFAAAEQEATLPLTASRKGRVERCPTDF